MALPVAVAFQKKLMPPPAVNAVLSVMVHPMKLGEPFQL